MPAFLLRNKHRAITLAVLSLGAFAHSGAAQPAVSPPPEELAMIIAASTGNLEAVKRLVSKGMDIDHRDFTGNTPLIYAARYARVELVQYLLRRGADVNASTHWGTTALKASVRKGSLPVVRALLAAGADVDHLDNRHESALFDAVRYRRLWAVDMLLARSAHVDIRNDQGYTPMVYAIEQHQPQILAELKQRMAAEQPSVDGHAALSGGAVPVRHTASRSIAPNPSLSGGDRLVSAVSAIP